MKFKRTMLKNGMRVITVHMLDNPTVTVLAMVEAGSKYETKNISGLSHFLEHMCFKGTLKRPTAFAIASELESIGSQFNAFTSEEYTGYYAKSAPKHLSKILDVISDLYLNPVFDEKEMAKEKGVIIEEINMYRDLPHRHVQELFMELLYGDQPAGWGVAGTRESVAAATRDDFIDYRAKHYVAEATTVIVAGNFDQEKIYQEIEEKFNTISSNKKFPKLKVNESQAAPQIKIEERKTDQTHIVLGVRAHAIGTPQAPATRILNAVLGAGMSSRLFQKLREEMGVGYYVRSSYDAYTDHGIFSVSIGCDKKRTEEVVRAIIIELNKMASELVSEEELNRTKEYLIGSMYLGLESSDALAEFYGYQEILRQPLRLPEDIVKEIKAVTTEDIKNIAKTLFVDKHLNLAVVGQVESLEKLQAALTFKALP